MKLYPRVRTREKQSGLDRRVYPKRRQDVRDINRRKNDKEMKPKTHIDTQSHGNKDTRGLRRINTRNRTHRESDTERKIYGDIQIKHRKKKLDTHTHTDTCSLSLSFSLRHTYVETET